VLDLQGDIKKLKEQIYEKDDIIADLNTTIYKKGIQN